MAMDKKSFCAINRKNGYVYIYIRYVCLNGIAQNEELFFPRFLALKDIG